MAVMSVVLVPRAAASAERIDAVLRTEPPSVTPRPPARDSPRSPASSSSGTSSSATPAPRSPCCAASPCVHARADDGDRRQHRLRQDHARQPHPPAVRRHRRRRARGRRRRPRAGPPGAVGRLGIVPQRAFLFSGHRRDNLRYGKPAATDDELWHALDVAQAATSCEQLPRPRRADRAGRHERLRRSAAAPGDRPGAGPRSRRSTCSTTASPRWTSRPTPDCGRPARRHRGRDGDRRRAAHQHHPRRGPDRRARRGQGRRRRHARRAARRAARRTPRSSTSQLTAAEAA